MSDSKLIKAAEEAAAVANGEIPAGRIWHQGHGYVPAARIEALAARVAKLEELLKECADDLSDSVEHYYEKTKDYPSEKRRYERDIEPVIKARAALGEAS